MKILRVLIVLVLLGVAAYFVLQLRGNGEDQDGLTLYGNVDIREVQMAFRVPGRISTMAYEEGDQVAAGDLLATLEDTPQRDALVVAAAGVAEAQARYDLLHAGARPQEIERARAVVQESEAGLANARQQFKRQTQLVEQDLSSDRLLDEARSARDQWQARHAQAQEGLALALEGFRGEEIAQAQAALDAANAQHAQLATQLSDTRLVAVSGGTIMTRVTEPGAMVNVGSPVYTVSLTDKTYIRAYVDEPNLGNVVPGARVTVTTDTDGREYQASVGFISPRAEFTPKSVETPALRTDLVYRLRIVVTDADTGLRQGMPVTVRIGD